MAWYSILPPQLIQFESWAVRIFFLLGLITIVPWAALIVFDAGLYLYRMALFELPWIGGRARGHQHPRVPGLNERANGQRRAFGLRGVESHTDDGAQISSSGIAEDPRAGSEARSEKENIAPTTESRAYAGNDRSLKRRVSGRT
ncbi:hypothetical protein N7462_009626 [Penicillium macrosclerotiorum]|uniref:uncharacterized protein n=1 Tax=Penicillium macrosclerotiorum TaxID=303699 RepID=UPI002547EBDC|nr:uncharacterized protein N7462_009626 [Penicillium macrosclerotiorum]KAJ5674187.1 hypothetical protein N7462_009626 [Penicillium macrosclerotiorum]